VKKADEYGDFKLTVSGVSIEPMTAPEIIETVRKGCNDVTSRYLPCVDFLVQCQQELRAGLALATRKRAHRHSYRDNMTPRQFYKQYLEPLPERFYGKNATIMSLEHLKNATREISDLCGDAKKNEHMGCETIKNTFLGGMRDGESWGLRRWLSKNGGALKSCNDLELIFQALQKLDREAENTRRIANKIRPIAELAHKRLKKEIPSAYQEISSAHPYLPFFHRLESALSGLANFDPDDDDVIIIDDEEEIQKAKQKTGEQKTTDTGTQNGLKRAASDNDFKRIEEILESDTKKCKVDLRVGYDKETEDFLAQNASELSKEVDEWMATLNGSQNSESRSTTPNNANGDSDCEVLCVMVKPAGGNPMTNNLAAASLTQPAPASLPTKTPTKKPPESNVWRCGQCTYENSGDRERCLMCESDDELDISGAVATANADPLFERRNGQTTAWANATHEPQHHSAVVSTDDDQNSAHDMATRLEVLAQTYEQGLARQHNQMRVNMDAFWNQDFNYAYILRLLATIMRSPQARMFLEPIDEEELTALGLPEYRSVIKNPLSFRDIYRSIIGNEDLSDGRTRSRKRGHLPGTSLSWNMKCGIDLLQAMDLVFLNCLAYFGKERDHYRNETTRLRKMLWDGIYQRVGCSDRINIPTKRGESSGFVVYKSWRR